MEIRDFREGDVLVLAPDGSVAGSEETSAIENRLGTALKAGFRLLVLDLAAVGKLPSDAIRVLLMTSGKLERTEGRLVLCGMNAKLKKAFSISGFDKDFIVVASREEALRRVIEPAAPRPPRRTKPSSAKGAAIAEAPAPRAPDVANPPTVVPAAPEAAAHSTAAAQMSAPASTVASPVAARRDALAAALLDALGVRAPRPDVVSSSGTTASDLDALASGILAALRAGGS